MRRWSVFAAVAAICLVVAPIPAHAQAPEKPKLSVGVGGKSLLYYLPLTIAERKGYFKAEGLDVEILDFPGGARALQALLGGSVDIVSGAYEHTISQQAKGQNIEALILQGKYAGIVLGDEQGEGRRVQVAGRPEGHEDRRHRARARRPTCSSTSCLRRRASSPTPSRSSASARRRARSRS